MEKLESESKRLACIKTQNAECKRILRKEKKCLEVENTATLKEFNQHQQEMINMEEEVESVGTRSPEIANLFKN